MAPLRRLTKRSEFLLAAKGRRVSTPGFVLQISDRHGNGDWIGMGFTCSKKVGNAVARNRAKRRLREIARSVLPVKGQGGYDYVLIGHAKSTAERPFPALLDDLRGALARVHG
ncbi:MAG: ribonuclease P protein component [Pseudomonadota bacterium]